MSEGIYLPAHSSTLRDIQTALDLSIAVEPIEKIIHIAEKEGRLTGYSSAEQALSAKSLGLISDEQYYTFLQYQYSRYIKYARKIYLN